VAQGGAGGFYESAESMEPMFLLDWSTAQACHGLGRLIVKSKHDERAGGGGRKKDLDAAGRQEVEEVGAALFLHHRAIYGAFSYYASLDSPQERDGTCDVWNMSFLSYLAFLRDCKVASKATPMRECELVWNVVNAEDKSMRDIGTMRFKNIRTLDRQAFIQCIVRLTIAKCVYATNRSHSPWNDAAVSTNSLLRMEFPIPLLYSPSTCFHDQFVHSLVTIDHISPFTIV